MKLGYDKGYVDFNIDEKRIKKVLLPNKVDVTLTGKEEVLNALEHPIGKDKIENLVKPDMKICIITSDITRPMPSKTVLPVLLEKLYLAGVKNENITIIFALGSHRHHSEEEKKYLVGEEIYQKIRCIDSDPEEVVHLGFTRKGTPVDIFKEVVESDFKICLGNIEYHYFAGYSGGAKAIMPGVSTPAAIQVNHKMMLDENAYAGNIDSPVRKDIEEAISMLNINYILNVVLDEHKNIIKAVAGDFILAHREGCKFLDSLYKIKLDEKADIVVVTPGGYPKDLNMYQAQKALDNAKHCVKDGGVIIWLASCKEGFGNRIFEEFMLNFNPDEMIKEIKREFRLGGHKAVAIAKVLKKAKIFLVSDLDDETVIKANLTPYHTLDEAFAKAIALKGNNASVYVMPYGGSTLPFIEK